MKCKTRSPTCCGKHHPGLTKSACELYTSTTALFYTRGCLFKGVSETVPWNVLYTGQSFFFLGRAAIVSHHASTLASMLYKSYDPAWGASTRAGYGRPPYVLLTLPDGRVFEGRAAAWTSTMVLVDWVDPDMPPEIVAGVRIRGQSAWTESENVRRIKRSEATNPDYHDDTEWFRQQEEA